MPGSNLNSSGIHFLFIVCRNVWHMSSSHWGSLERRFAGQNSYTAHLTQLAVNLELIFTSIPIQCHIGFLGVNYFFFLHIYKTPLQDISAQILVRNCYGVLPFSGPFPLRADNVFYGISWEMDTKVRASVTKAHSVVINKAVLFSSPLPFL